MALRKTYIQIRHYLYSKRFILNKIAIFLMIATLFYMFFNYFFFETFIISQANTQEAKKEYKSAILYYKIARFYYKHNHATSLNKKIFMEISYKIALCELENKDETESNIGIRRDLAKIQKTYGIYSKETAYFLRKYLIEYYFLANKIPLAQQEFENAVTIYTNIGYDGNTMADLIRIGGDLYNQQKSYETAYVMYENAYNVIIKEPQMDYEVFTEIVNRIAEYQIKQDRSDIAEILYKNSLEVLRNAPYKKNEAIASTLLRLGDLYAKDDNTTIKAVNCYEEAIDIIKKLPRISESRQNINTYLSTLKDLYNKSNQPQKAMKIQDELTARERFPFLY